VAPAHCGSAYAWPSHSLLTWEGDSELLRSSYLADSSFGWAHMVTLAALLLLASVREHLTTATAMYREMDMSFYLQQAEAVTRELT
jgi:hypothetical protein